MTPRTKTTVALSEMTDGQEADLFVQLTSKQDHKTRDGKPYWRVGFRDAKREVNFPIWSDSAWATDCRDAWTPGEFYKLRATYRDTQYGPQLEIEQIRPATDSDRADGFDPQMLEPQPRFSPDELFDELLDIAGERIENEGLHHLVLLILEANREALLRLPAATRNHHAFAGGYLEHVVAVTRTCIYLADKYAEHYADLKPPLDKDLIVAGGILHDIGKLRELEPQPVGAEYTAEGNLIGHILQGRDIIREAAAECDVQPELLLRLEHIIVSHQRLPEWGSPKPPMTPEALLVHFADDTDAKLYMMYAALVEDTTAGPFTSRQNALGQKIYRGEVE